MCMYMGVLQLHLNNDLIITNRRHVIIDVMCLYSFYRKGVDKGVCLSPIYQCSAGEVNAPSKVIPRDLIQGHIIVLSLSGICYFPGPILLTRINFNPGMKY